MTTSPNNELSNLGKQSPEFHEFLREKLGPEWVLARRTKRILDKYGHNVACISHERYKQLQDEWDRLYVAPKERLRDAAPDMAKALQCLLWKAEDQLFALKDSKNTYTDSSEYVTQLKEYIDNGRAALRKAGVL